MILPHECEAARIIMISYCHRRKIDGGEVFLSMDLDMRQFHRLMAMGMVDMMRKPDRYFDSPLPGTNGSMLGLG